MFLHPKMARVDTPDISDDDFAMVNSTSSNSPAAVTFQTPKLISRLQPSQQPGPSRINSDGGGDAAADQSSVLPIDGSFISSFNSQAKDSNHTSFFQDVNVTGFKKMTKSLYKKLTGKDILIAVMGYSHILQAGECLAYVLIQDDGIWKDNIHCQCDWTDRPKDRPQSYFMCDDQLAQQALTFLLTNTHNRHPRDTNHRDYT